VLVEESGIAWVFFLVNIVSALLGKHITVGCVRDARVWRDPSSWTAREDHALRGGNGRCFKT